MAERLMKYNPAFLKEAELVRGFVVRQEELGLVMRVIRENTSESNQHMLVTGPRGIGKTTLVLRAVAEVRRDEELSKRWYPVVFGEESYLVKTAGEFWLEALFHLRRQTKEERFRRAYEELRDEVSEDRLRERALGELMDYADEQGKRLLLVVENLNMVVDEQMKEDDAWKLRETLLHEGRVMLLATATRGFAGVENCGKAMFELFRTLELAPLEEDECRVLWEAVTGVKLVDDRIRPVQILTGGSPRLLTIISTFGKGLSFRELMGDLIQLVDEHTEYFKSHLDSLPAVERSVYLALAELWDQSTAREVAKAAREEVSKTSSLLNRLVKRGVVTVVDEKGRTKWYQVAERMYNIYYLMRRRGTPSRRVRAVVNFMVHFYGPDELVEITKRIAEEACKLGKIEANEHCLAFKEILSYVPDEVRFSVLRSAPREFLEMLDVPGLGDLAKKKSELDLVERFRHAIEKEDLEGIEEEVNEAVSLLPENWTAWAILGMVKYRKESYDGALQAFEKVVQINPTSVVGWSMIGIVLHSHFGRTEDAQRAIEKAIDLGDRRPVVMREYGEILLETGDYERAEEVLRDTLEREPEVSSAWGNLGIVLEKQGKKEEAVEQYSRSLEINPSYAEGWMFLGNVLCDLDRYEEAEKAFRRAIALEPEEIESWIMLGRTLAMGVERYKEAETVFEKCTDLEPEIAHGWFLLGQLKHRGSRDYDSAEEHYRKALELEPELTFVLASLCMLLVERRRYVEAIEGVGRIVEHEEFCRGSSEGISYLAISLAGAGYGREMLEVLEESASASVLEPLVVGLKLYLGDDVKSAVEIVEVGKDVVKRIEKKKRELEGGID